MAMISCPECGKQISDRAVSCPACGCPISSAPAAPARQNTADEAAKLLVLARRAREGSDSKNAARYYNQILDKDPGNWEAIFYTVYFEAFECKIMNIASAANSVANCIFSTFSAISDLKSEEEQAKALSDITSSAVAIASMFVNGAVNHYNQFSTASNAFSECADRVSAAGNIYREIESGYKTVFPEKPDRLAAFQLLYIQFLNNNSRWFEPTYRSNTLDRLDKEIAAVNPVYGERRGLEKQIDALNTQIARIVTQGKAGCGFLGWIFLLTGIIMAVLGVALISMTGETNDIWPILVAIPELLLAYVFLKKRPSEKVIQENLRKKEELTRERDQLQDQLNKLK